MPEDGRRAEAGLLHDEVREDVDAEREGQQHRRLEALLDEVVIDEVAEEQRGSHAQRHRRDESLHDLRCKPCPLPATGDHDREHDGGHQRADRIVDDWLPT